MRPVAAIPMNDPNGMMFPHLQTITPTLKEIFGAVYVSLNATTHKNVPEMIDWLSADNFFHITVHPNDPPIGQDFLQLYSTAAEACEPAQILHLCFIDRIAYALQSEWRQVFMADVMSVDLCDTPLVFMRSEAAWATHPSNYRDSEQMVVTAGEWLFSKTLDFSWCHLAIQAQQLLKVIPQVKGEDMSFFAEVILAMRNEIGSKEVDWLAWEDPFILGRDTKELKGEREASVQESRKRLSTATSMLKLLLDVTKDR